ncbi:MAG: hypothetical protein K6F32_03875 [Bacilli bacterium]|nr:hypothetical protein [Bacilli bacterium]
MKQRALPILAISLLLASCGQNNVTSSTDSISEAESTASFSTVQPASSEEEIVSSEAEVSSEEQPIDMAAIDKELYACFRYLSDTTNLSETSKGYGLVQDRYTDKSVCSIAATGFALAAYPVFVEQGYITKEEGEKRASLTLDTVLRIQADDTTSYEGCIAHFVNRRNGSRNSESEISTIDTAILISGAIVAGEYFEGAVLEKAIQAWSNVDYNAFLTSKNGKTYVSMGIKNLETKAQLSPWDYYAEQLMIYILGAGNPVEEHRLSSSLYKSITRAKGEYAGITHIYSWFGSLFTYQYSQAFFNFKLYDDFKGNNFYTNSVLASQTNYAFCKSLASSYASFDSPGWGLSACDGPLGYTGELGAAPRGFDGYNSTNYLMIQGTITPCAAIGSMPFTPRESYDALVYYQSLPGLNDDVYGLRDSYNLDFNGAAWYDADFIGIDKGIEVLQLYNYKNPDFVCSLPMDNGYVKAGFLNNEFVEVAHE